jgi:hypothetical protein
MTSTGSYGDDPSGGRLADVARTGAREWQQEMAAWEGDAELLRLRQRTVGNVLWEAMQRGDRVTAAVGRHTFTGMLAAARGDLAILETPDMMVALHVGALDTVHLERSGGGVTGDRTYGSLRAYLGMLEVEAAEARIVGRDLDVSGRVIVAADDHVLLATPGGGETAVGIPAIGAVVTSPL